MCMRPRALFRRYVNVSIIESNALAFMRGFCLGISITYMIFIVIVRLPATFQSDTQQSEYDVTVSAMAVLQNNN